VPPKINPRDWDRLFRDNAPRRGGPLRILLNLLIAGLMLGLIAAAVVLSISGFSTARSNTAATQSANATNVVVILATRTAQALERTATSAALVIPTPTAQPSPTPWIGSGTVLNGGNLRSEPIIAEDTIIGQICPGDRIDFLEQRDVAENNAWYRIRVIETAGDCTPQRVTVGSSGWASATLLSTPER
jgi:type II secretory pathway pseudopilin PulG